ncbi:hypothetical protein J4211_03860 [Candidatus Woesearchaeota archaeon]|nr:hypothetical protein [Candidatus Woesearchaeota archaeon]
MQTRFTRALDANYEFKAAGALPEPCVYAAIRACGVSRTRQTDTLTALLADGVLRREEAMCCPPGVGTTYFLAQRENTRLF